MTIDARFDQLLETLAGFHRTWIIHLGLELGLLERIRAAGEQGIPPDDLADAAGCTRDATRAWAIAADAHDVATFDGEHLRLDPVTARILLDEDHPDYLGGQLSHAVVASLDHDRMVDVFRTGVPVTERPNRYRASIERLTRLDIAVFFQEALGLLPELVSELSNGVRVVDLHCGGGRWLVAMARRFPGVRGLGVEFEADSVERARRSVAEAGLQDRVEIVQADLTAIDRSVGQFDLAYFQYALHELKDPVGALRAGWAALAPGGRLLVLDWCAPVDLEEYRTLHGRLVSGVQLDELFQGSRLRTLEEFVGLFAEADLPGPDVLDLPSGATLLLVRRSD